MILFVYMLLFFYTCMLFKNNKFNKRWILEILNIPFGLVGNAIFLPLLQTLAAIFYCDSKTKHLSYISEMKCWSLEHIIHCILGGAALIVLIVFEIFNIYTFSDIRKNSFSCTSKKSNEADLSLILLKIYVVAEDAIYAREGYDFSVILISAALCFFVAYNYFYYRPFYNKTIMTIYLCLISVLAYSYLCLIACYLLRNSNFNGGIGLFFCGSIMIVIFLIGNSVKMVDYGLVIMLPLAIKTERTFLDKLEMLEMLLDLNEKDRKCHIMLDGYIGVHEDSCATKTCPLKEFLKTGNQRYLLRHIEDIYLLGVSRFPTSVTIRLGYVQFLLNKLHKKKQAENEILEIQERCEANYNEQFCIYQLNRMIEATAMDKSNGKDEASVFAEMKFISMQKNFKQDVNDAVINYLEFWNLLMISSANIVKDLGKLADVGDKIAKLNGEINEMYQELIKINPNDKELNQLYTSYQINILNNIDFVNTNNDKVDELKDIDDSNQMVKENKSIIVSANPENFGIITNISLSACSLFGFIKEEMVGQHLNLIVPEIFQKPHNKLLQTRANTINQENIFGGKDDKQLMKEISQFAVNKARYIIPFSAKIYSIQGERGELNFLAAINQGGNTISSSTCYVLTNEQFLIQNFSANGINLLNLHSNMLNGTCEILKYIKQFQEELIARSIEIEKEHIKISKLDLKKGILNKKFNKPMVVNWNLRSQKFMEKNNIVSEDRYKAPGLKQYTEFSTINATTKNDDSVFLGGADNDNSNANAKKTFILSVEKCKFGKVTYGYLFRFETEFHDKDLELISTSKETTQVIFNDKKSNNPGRNFSSSNVSNLKKSSDLQVTPQPRKITSIANIHEDINNGNNNQSNNNKQVLNKLFVPKMEKPFMLDVDKMVFVQHKNLTQANEIKENLKEIAIKKVSKLNEIYLNAEKKRKNSNSENEEDEENENNEGEENEDDEDEENDVVNSSLEEDIIKPAPFQTNIKNKLFQITDEYYHVKMDKITFMLYDYKSRTTIKVNETNHKSEVEQKLSDEKIITSDEKAQKEKEKAVKIANEQKNTKNGKNDDNKLNDINNLNPGNKSVEMKTFIKEIGFALQRKDTQKTVLIIKLVSLVILGMILIEIAGYTYFLKGRLDNIDMYLELLTAGNQFFIDMIITLLHVRELTLLSSSDYQISVDVDRDTYIENSIQEVKEYYQKLEEELETITSDSMMVSRTVFEKLSNRTVELEVLDDDQTISVTKMTRNEAFTLMVTSLFRISRNNIDEIIPLNKDVFLFLINSLNANYVNCVEQQDLFFSEITNAFKNQINTLIIICVVFVFVNFSSFFVFKFFYEDVVDKKESYIQVFYSINNKIISDASTRCEKFLFKLNNKNNKDQNGGVTLLDDDDEESVGGVLNEFGDLVMEKNEPPKEVKKSKIRIGHRGNKNQKRSNPLIYLVWIGLILIGSFAIIFSTAFQSLKCQNGKVRQVQIKNEVNIQIESIMAFNLMREYFFNEQALYNYSPLSEYAPTLIDTVYQSVGQEQKEITDNVAFSDEDKKIYTKVMTGNLCEYAELKGTDEENTAYCSTMSDGTIIQGLTIVQMHYFEEIREIYTKFLILQKTQTLYKEECDFSYNLTLLGTDQAEKEIPEDPKCREMWNYSHPMNIFNLENNRRIFFLLTDIMIPAYNDVYVLLISHAVFDSKYILKIELIVNCAIGAVLILLYVFVWKRHEASLNETIYKTKKMLSIIPVETLMKVKNIAKLLGIEGSETDHRTSSLWGS